MSPGTAGTPPDTRVCRDFYEDRTTNIGLASSCCGTGYPRVPVPPRTRQLGKEYEGPETPLLHFSFANDD
eukprot:3553144-Rhodomonas_salina.1